MTRVLLPAGIIATFFVITWLVLYPKEIWELLTLQDHTRTGRLVSLGIWIYFIAAVATINWIATP